MAIKKSMPILGYLVPHLLRSIEVEYLSMPACLQVECMCPKNDNNGDISIFIMEMIIMIIMVIYRYSLWKTTILVQYALQGICDNDDDCTRYHDGVVPITKW